MPPHEPAVFTFSTLDGGWRAGLLGVEELSAALERRVQEFTLPNGLTFLVLERRLAPIVSCHTYADVGAFDEDAGQTGIAHLLEHMAFKGSQRIGTQDFSREAPLLDALDEGAAPRPCLCSPDIGTAEAQSVILCMRKLCYTSAR